MKHEVEPEGIAMEAPQYVPTIHVEISKEQAESLALGDNTEVIIKGRVKGLDMRDNDQEDGRYNLELELKEVAITDDGEMTEDNKAIADLLEDDE